MEAIRKKAIQGLQVGDRFVLRRMFTEADAHQFAGITGDYNPVHFEPRFCGVKGFTGPICHGLLVAAMISEIGGQIGWLASGMQFEFKKPVYFGDCIDCEMVITEIDERGRAKALAEYRNQDDLLVMKAVLEGVLPGRQERAVMAQMVAEGDPTNRSGEAAG
jgi:acyl dehydratase